MIFCINFAYLEHVLKSILSRSKKKAVIAITSDTKKGALDPSTTATITEKAKESIHIKTVQKSRQDCTLANSIPHVEVARELAVPTDIGKLVDVDEDQESKEDDRES